MTKLRFLWLFEIPMVMAILGLALFLRLYNIENNPAWYTDEATHIDIARHLKAGEIQYMAVEDSVMFFARPPLFHLILAGVFSIQDEGFRSIRLLTGSLGVISVGLLWWVLRCLLSPNRLFPLLATLMMAIYPQAVLYSRYGFSYNLLVPLTLLMVWGMGEYLRTRRRKWLVLAAFSIGFGFICDLMMLTFVIPLMFVVWSRRWRDGLWSLPLIAVPFLCYALLMLNDAFIFDLKYTLGRLQGPPLWEQPAKIADSYVVLISQDIWMLSGVIGVFLIRPARLAKLTALLLFFPLFNLGRIASLYSLSFYYLIPILPFVAIGVAGLLYFGVPMLWRFFTEGLHEIIDLSNHKWLRHGIVFPISGVVIAILIMSPFLITLDHTAELVQSDWPNPISPFLISPHDAHRVADYLNPRLHTNDMVVVSPPIAVLLNANVTDFTMASAIFDGKVMKFWGDVEMPLKRFHHDPRYTEARFVIIDNLWRNFGIYHGVGVPEMMEDVETNWQLVFRVGEIAVYENLGDNLNYSFE